MPYVVSLASTRIAPTSMVTSSYDQVWRGFGDIDSGAMSTADKYERQRPLSKTRVHRGNWEQQVVGYAESGDGVTKRIPFALVNSGETD